MLWATERGRTMYYRLRDAAAEGTGTSTTVHLSAQHPVARLAAPDGDLPPIIDSDRAVSLGDAAAGRAFRQRTGAHLESMRLSAGPDGRFVWGVGYSRLNTPDQLVLDLDAQTNSVVRCDDRSGGGGCPP